MINGIAFQIKCNMLSIQYWQCPFYVLVGQDDSMVPVDLMTYNGKEDDSALSTATIPSS